MAGSVSSNRAAITLGAGAELVGALLVNRPPRRTIHPEIPRCGIEGLRPLLTLPLVLPASRRRSPGTSPVHTQPFAFRPPEEDDESVKISNTTDGRSSALSPAFTTTRLRAASLQKRQFLFNTNERLSRNPNLATRTKQSTSFFLFNTNERSQVTTHQSLLTTHDSTKSRRAASPLRRALVAVMLRRDFRGVTCN